MNARRAQFAVWLAILTLAGCRDSSDASRIGAPSFAAENAAQIVTIDHQVPHISTVPANAGELVHLFVRERVSSNRESRKVVLMVHGASVPALAAFELRTESYDWALWLAQAGGFDVFMLDLQGSGLSPRPRMDDPCNVPAAQQSILIPNPLSGTCAPSYPFQLVTARSDWDELNAVVDYIRSLRGVDKVALIGWSHGAVRIGPYAVQHPDKIESVLFYAPFYNPAAPAGRQGTGVDGFGPPIDPRTGLPFVLPQPGTPMTLTTRPAFMDTWNREIKCDGQVEEGIQDVVWSAIMDNDAIGRTWAPPVGVMRVRTFFLWGWNSATAGRISVPALIIHGALDVNVPATQGQLYDDLSGIPGNRRLLFKVDCAGHQIGWERQRQVLHHISKEWLRHGAVDGRSTGKLSVDLEGGIHPQP